MIPGGASLQAQVPPAVEPTLSPVPRQTDASEGARLIRSDDQAVVFEVSVPALAARPVTFEGRTYQALEISGYGLTGEPGAPALPGRSYTLGVPPGAEVALSVIEAESGEQSIGRVKPVETIHFLPSLTGELDDYTTEVVTDPDVYAHDALIPSAPVTMGAPAWLRDQRIVQVSVQPVQYNPAQGTARAYTRLVVQLSFAYPDGRPALQARPESADYERVIRSTLLNYESASAWRTRADPPLTPLLPSCTQTAGFSGNTLYKVSVSQDGVYQLTYSALQSAGVPVNSVNPRTFKLCDAGAEVAILEQGDGDQTFESGEKLVFYGRKATTKYTDTNVYWLAWGGANGQRMASVNGTPSGATVPPDYTTTLHVEENHEYYSFIPPSNGNNPPYSTHDHWFWNVIGYNFSGVPRAYTYTVNLSRPVTAGYTPMIDLSLWTGASPYNAHVKLYLNNQTQPGWEWTWSTPPPNYRRDDDWLNVQVPINNPAWLVDGANYIRVEALPSASAAYTVVTDWFKITYKRPFAAQNDKITFGAPAGTWRYQVSDFTTPNIAAFDITNPAQPKYVSPPSSAACADQYRLFLPIVTRDATGLGEGQAGMPRRPAVTFEFQATSAAPVTYTVQTAAQCLLPTITADTPSNLQQGRADHIMITHASLSNAALTPLVNLRQSQGRTVRVVDVQDVYDEFSDGELHAQGIHDFLWHANQNWAPPAPTFVLFVGDGHYDYKNYYGLSAPNLIPPYLVNVDFWQGQSPADNRFVSNPPSYISSTVPFMSAGRLPVNNTAELTAVVNKLVSYEPNPNPPAAWRHQMAFVTDNGLGRYPPPPPTPTPVWCAPDPAGNFFQSSDGIISSSVPSSQPLDRIYFDPEVTAANPNGCYPGLPQYTTPEEVRAAIGNEVNSGRIFVNYYGHGGVQYWAAEGLLRFDMIPAFGNGSRLPVMLPWTCLVGRFDYPQATNAGLEETMFRHAAGGSVAAFTPTGLQVDTEHHYLNARFYDTLFAGGVRAVGLLADAARTNVPVGSADLIDTYMVMGDPATLVQIELGP
jgi:hypothetical protein